jgi:tight adherence protein B
LIGVVVGAAAYILPRQILVHLWLRRMRRFEIQLVESLPYLANNLRSGMALPQAVESLITNSEPPLSEEFGFTMREYSHGKTLSEAFEAMRHRIPSLNLKLILMAVDICREQGGNLSDLLEGMSDDLREIHGIDEKVQSLTAEGRLQAKLLAVSPLVLGAMMYFAQPEMQESFYGSIAGKGLTVLAILLTVGGFLWMKKIVKIEV